MATETITSTITVEGTAQCTPTAPIDPIKSLPQKLVDQMTAMFGYHAGFRTTHAKGLLVGGTFTPTKEAKTLSVAPHFNSPSTPIQARFSVGGGIPTIPDADPQATPKGVAIRFLVDKNTHTDLVAHSFNGFATSNGQDFLTFLQLFSAVGIAQKNFDDAGKCPDKDTSSEKAQLDEAKAVFAAWLQTHKSAATFVNSPKPNPHNYGTLRYFQPNTHVLTNADGNTVNVRYRLDPADGEHLHDAATAATLPRNYLEDDLRERFPDKPIALNLHAHIANPNDVLDDATVPYQSTTWVPVGTIEINSIAPDNDNQQQHIFFSPSPERGGVQGMTSSQDPLIQTRKDVYYISGRRRDAAEREKMHV